MWCLLRIVFGVDLCAVCLSTPTPVCGTGVQYVYRRYRVCGT